MKKLFLFITLISISFLVFSQDYFYKNLNAGKLLPDISKYRSNKPEDIIFSIPENITIGLSNSLEKYSPTDDKSANVEKYFDQLIYYLISWTNDDYLKIKSIYDWISHNISYNMAGLRYSYNYQSVLKYKYTVCGGYSILFYEMAKKAGFEVEYITGVASANFSSGGHAWNIVKINDIYYPIDTTAGYGYKNSPESSAWFLVDPVILSYTHYPDNPKWLLTDYYVTEKDYNRGKSSESYGIQGKWIAAESIDEKEILLDKYPDEIEKNKLLAIAANYGDIKIVELLVKYGADVNYVFQSSYGNIRLGKHYGNIDSNTPLQLAMKNGHLEVARLLVENGAKPITTSAERYNLPLNGDVSVAFNKNYLDIYNYFVLQTGFTKGWPTASMLQLYGFSIKEPVLSYELNAIYKVYENNVLGIFLHNTVNLAHGFNAEDFNSLSVQLISQIIDEPYPVLKNGYWGIYIIDPIIKETQEFQYVLQFDVERIKSGIRILISPNKLNKNQQKMIDNDSRNLYYKRYKMKKQ